jgi:hypothetical protein
MTPHIHLMCEVPASVDLFRAECSLSDVDWHFYPNNSPCNLFNVSITNREKMARNDRILIEKRNTRFKQNWY